MRKHNFAMMYSWCYIFNICINDREEKQSNSPLEQLMEIRLFSNLIKFRLEGFFSQRYTLVQTEIIWRLSYDPCYCRPQTKLSQCSLLTLLLVNQWAYDMTHNHSLATFNSVAFIVFFCERRNLGEASCPFICLSCSVCVSYAYRSTAKSLKFCIPQEEGVTKPP